jgi:hypothetical protein
VPRWLKERLRDADDALDALRQRPRRIVFDARTPMNYAMWRPIAERLARDPRIEQWHMAGEEVGRPYALYAQVGVRDRVISRLEAQLMRFDLYVSADFVATWLKRRVRRLHIFHGVAGKYDFDRPDPSIGPFDAFCFVNRHRMRRYRRQGIAPQGGAFLVGMPKVDRLVDGSLSRDGAVRALGADPVRPTVLYAPTWSPQSSLVTMGEPLLATLAARLDVTVLVKLHDRAFDPRPEYSAGHDWAARLARLEQGGRVRLVRDADSTTVVAASDVLVTDHSSIGFEFLLLDRPVVILDRPELLTAARVTARHARWLRQAGRVAGTVEDAVALVRDALADPRKGSGHRRRVARRLFYRPGSATDRALQVVYGLLQLAPPRTAVAQESHFDARTSDRGDPRSWSQPAADAAHS